MLLRPKRVPLGPKLLVVLLVALLVGGFAAHVRAQSGPDTAPPPTATPDTVAPAGATPPTSEPEIDARSGNGAVTDTPTSVGLNTAWTLVAGFLVMFMQAGFALVETGLCRAKNAAHVMYMNFLVYALGMTGFFVCGFALMCGGAGGVPGAINSAGAAVALTHPFQVTLFQHQWTLFGTEGFFLSGNGYNAGVLTWFLFMMVFMDTTATIPTGALAERWKMTSFFIFSLFIGGFIYPIYGGWVWGGGWLSQLSQTSLGVGALDYAGSSVVHMQGGVLALVTSMLLGPRIGKYINGKAQPILAHNIPFVILGTFILAFGWFGFNAGSSLAADGRIGVVAANTMLASAAGALASTIYMAMVYGKPDPTMACNGMLAGLVAITAPCAYVAPWAAFVIGVIAGVLVIWSVFFFEKTVKVDDPVGAISVHGVCGLFGLLCVGIFADGSYGAVGFLYDSAGWNQFWAQCIAGVACFVWNFVVGGAIFYLIGLVIGGNRVSEADEIEGLDIPELGVPAYPDMLPAGSGGGYADTVAVAR